MPDLVETKSELRANTLAFAAAAPNLASSGGPTADAIANGCSHAVEWVAFEEAGDWKVAFCKFAGYNGLNFPLYDKLRQTHLTGTDTKRRVEKFGGTYYGVGRDAGVSSNHPAVAAVEKMCAAFGKTPKRTAKVRVYPSDGRPATMDVVLAAIRAAEFSQSELDDLVNELRAA